MAARRSYIIKAVVRHLFATVEECLTRVTHTGRGRVTTGGLYDQNPHRNVGVLLPSRFRHRDRDCGCQPDHLRTSKWNQRGPAAALPGPFACADAPGAIAINIITVPLETTEVTTSRVLPALTAREKV